MFRRGGRILGVVLSSVLFLANVQADDSFYRVSTAKNEIKIMAYNVQNLFDATHDEGKNDYEFLPLSSPLKKHCGNGGGYEQSCRETNWTAPKATRKLQTIKIALDAQGDYPDILALSEVENPEIVSRLAELLGYDAFYMTDSPDRRGIDLAVLFRETKVTPISFEEREVKGVYGATRNVSVATFQLSKALGGGTLAVFPVHWPSQGGPTPERLKAAAATRELVDSSRGKHKRADYHAVILGDFNTLNNEKPHPIDSVLLDQRWAPKFADIHEMAVKAKSPYIDRMPQGTYYYHVDKAWNEFDHILVNDTLADGKGLEADPISYRIHAPAELSKSNEMGERIPFRYNHKTESTKFLGFSDHFAVHVKLRYGK